VENAVNKAEHDPDLLDRLSQASTGFILEEGETKALELTLPAY
jgi:hypothetical protein